MSDQRSITHALAAGYGEFLPRYGQRAHIARLLARISNLPEPGQERGRALPDDVNMVARERREAPKVVTQRLSKKPFPGGKNVKSAQAWKYAGNNIVRAPSIEINGRYYTDPKETDAGTVEQQAQPIAGGETGTPRRKQESNFFITINPNQAYVDSTLADRARKHFETALHHLESNAVLARCLKFGPKHEHYAQDIAHDVLIPGIDWKSTVEVGEKQNRMHGHIICYIQHYSQIQIDPKMMMYEFRMAFNSGLQFGDPLILKDPPYLQVKMLPQSDWTTIMRQYIRKGMSA